MPFVEIPRNSIYTRVIPKVAALTHRGKPVAPPATPIIKKVAFVPNFPN